MKKCRIVIVCAIIFLGIALIFMPYREYDMDSSGRPIGDHTRWKLPQSGLTRTRDTGALNIKIHEYDYPVRHDILAIEILGIFAGSFALCSVFRKKDRKN
ncbi:MAG: hypothetical protein ABFD52_02665 [Acidobacteriota bacterium]